MVLFSVIVFVSATHYDHGEHVLDQFRRSQVKENYVVLETIPVATSSVMGRDAGDVVFRYGNDVSL